MRQEMIEDLAAINKNIAAAQRVAQTINDDFEINKIIVGFEQLKEMLHNKMTEHVYDLFCALCLKLSAVISAQKRKGILS